MINNGKETDSKNGLDQNRTPLLDAIVEYTQERPVYFKIPGHRYEKGISPRWRQWTGDGIFRFDLTEAEGLDDLHCPEGVIREAQELAAGVFGAKATYFLVNGTTCGNEAMVLACAGEGDKIMIPRNAHKSVLMGLIMSGATPIYLMPRYDEKTGLCGCISPEDVEEGFRRHPDCKGVFLVSPTYYGVCSDIKAISEICHRHHAVLLVDEAHGGHLYFGAEAYGTGHLPQGAIQQGADLCAQSMHKVTGSLTQSSLLHVGSDRIDRGKLESALHMVQSTSPSYLLMTSLDAARYELAQHGPEMLQKAEMLASDARKRIEQIPGINCYGQEIKNQAIFDLDTSRLVIEAEGMTGFELADLLYEEYRVGMELADVRHVVAVVTYANEQEDMDRLVEALRQIASDYNVAKTDNHIENHKKISGIKMTLPAYVMSPRQAYFAEKKEIAWENARGKIAGEALIPYPPGIPLVNPGERISDEIWEYMENYRKNHLHFHGTADKTLRRYKIIPG